MSDRGRFPDAATAGARVSAMLAMLPGGLLVDGTVRGHMNRIGHVLSERLGGAAQCQAVRPESGPGAPEASPNELRSFAPMAWAIETKSWLLSLRALLKSR